MIVEVGEHKCKIIKTPVNEKEINITKVKFEFDSKIPTEYVKKAFFTLNNESYEQIIVNNECDIPSEVLEEKGQVRLGVIAYQVEDEEYIQRFNPSPTYFDTWEGSLVEAHNSSKPTPTQLEQIESEIATLQDNVQELDQNKQDLLVSGENIKTINNESLLGSGNLEVITDLSDYYTKGQTNNLLDTKQDKSSMNEYYKKTETYSKEEVDTIKTTIEGEIPTKLSELDNDTEYITKEVNNLTNYTKTSDMNNAISNAVGTETTNRQNSDVALQNQIDAITSASDVVDVVSTYQDLLDYDTSKLTDKDVIKVMQDSTHSNALSYYRWNTSTFDYVGSEGPFYTKGETDTLLNQKANQSTTYTKTETDTLLNDKVGFTDYGTQNKAGVIKSSNTYGIYINSSGVLMGQEKDYATYQTLNNNLVVSKGTLENVITGKELTNKTYVDSANEEQDTQIEELQEENTYLNNVIDQLPRVNGSGTSITLNNTIEAKMKCNLSPSEMEQATSTQSNQLFDKNAITENAWLIEDGTLSLNHSDYVVSDYMKVKPNTDYYKGYSGSARTKYYDSNKQPLNTTTYQDISIGGAIGTFTTPANAYYVRVTFIVGSSSTVNLDTYMLNEGTTALPYEPFTPDSPSPDYPSNIHTTTGDNVIRDEGKNLANSLGLTTQTINGITFTPHYTNGMLDYINVNGTATDRADYQFTNTFVLETDTYNASKGIATSDVRMLGVTVPGGAAPINVDSVENRNYTISGTTTLKIWLRVLSGISVNNAKIYPMIEKGSSKTSYEPYTLDTYPLNLPVENLISSSRRIGNLLYLNGTTTTTDYIFKAGTYTCSYEDINTCYLYYRTATTDTTNLGANKATTFTINEDFNLWLYRPGMTDDEVTNIQLEKGSKANSYTPYGTPPLEYSKIENNEDEFIIPSGKNLLENTLLTTETTKNGVTFTPYSDGSVYLSGTATSNTYINLSRYNFGDTPFNSNTGGSSVYTASIGNTSISSNDVFIAYDANNNYTYIFVKNGASINAKIYPMIRKVGTSSEYEPYNNNKWYLKKNTRHISLAIADMNNSEDYPGWKDQEQFKEEYPNMNSTFYQNGIVFKCNITNNSQGLMANTISSAANGLIMLNRSIFALTQTQWKEQYPNLVVELHYGLQNSEYILCNDTLQTQLTNIYNNMISKKGQTNLSQVNDDLPMVITASALLDLNTLVS